MAITVKAETPFKILYNLPEGINLIIAIGGRGGMKSYEIAKFIAFSSTIKKKRCVILRDEHSLIRESILNEILLKYDTANASGALDQFYQRLDIGIKDRATNEMLVFTKGFRASAKEKRSNLKSISNIDIAVIEEFEDIRNPDQYNTFVDSIRNEGALIILALNTPDVNHFIIKQYFNLDQVEDGFFEITPKDIPGFLCIKTSFKDNPYLPQHIKDRYQAYGDPLSHLYNPFYYKTAILGWASTGRKGQILTKVKPIKLIDYLKLPFKEYYGQDFGTASPAGLVGVKFDKNNCYCRQINYLPMDTLSIAKKYCELQLTNSDKIVADSAEPKTIDRLKNGYKNDELPEDVVHRYPALLKGFYVVPCVKGIGSIKTGIGLMTSMNLFAVEESTDLWMEILNWVYAVDKNNNPTDEPLDDFNHLIDPWRYVVSDYKGITSTLAGLRGLFG